MADQNTNDEYINNALKCIELKKLSNKIRPVVTVAATQFSISWDISSNIKTAEKLVRKAAKSGAQIILLQELFETPYFCQLQRQDFFNLASTNKVSENSFLNHFRKLAAELNVVLPISFFEKEGQAYYNSIIVFDADGSNLGIYRKSHIPDGIGYQEKFYFNPGDTGFKVFNTKYANIGIGICWDQWFPETARCLALLGAEMILYPTAIGSEPQDSTLDSRHHWRRVMQGHAGANIMPVIASNRTGVEKDITFYGTSFITDHLGAIVVDADDHSEAVITATFDLEFIKDYRSSWGVFRDRRPNLYQPIMTLDGSLEVTAFTSIHKDVKKVVPKPLPRKLLGNPKSMGFKMPAEFDAHKQCWMAWPIRQDNWRCDAGPAQNVFVEVIKAIANFEPISVLVNPGFYELAYSKLSVHETNYPIRVIEMLYDDIWLRDIGPTFLVHDKTGQVAGVDWEFNAWGGMHGGCYTEWGYDNATAGKILELEGVAKFKAEFVMEGGSIHVDGQGTVITTEETLLNKNRNPNLSKEDIECRLREYLGVSTVIWIPEGVYGDEDTNGHVDNICCYARPGEVILAWTDDKSDPQYERSLKALQVLESSVDARGRKLKVHKLYMPTPVIMTDQESAGLKKLAKSTMLRETGTRLAATYVNFYMANGGIVMPGFNDPINDAKAVETLKGIFGSEYEIVQIQARDIILGGGNIHCITQQQPLGF